MSDPPSSGSRSLQLVVAAIKAAWDRGAPPDAQAALASHPELRSEKLVVLDLAYEEFCRRRDAGEDLDPSAFVTGFPRYQSSLRNVLDCHLLLAGPLERLPGQDVAPPRWPEPGEDVGDLALLRELGQGAFARVFLAREGSTGDRAVVVKLSQEASAEACTLGPLDHDNIVSVLSAQRAEASGLHVVRMPFLGTATLHDLLDVAFPEDKAAPPRQAAVILVAARSQARADDPAPTRRLTNPGLERGSYVDGVVRLAIPLAGALAHLHKCGIVHRDLKPSNVLLSPDGRPLLLDFNLAARRGAAAQGVGGTLPYMAPEQVQSFLNGPSEANVPGARSDLFSLGVILYELLSGHHPFGPVQPGGPGERFGPTLLRRQREGCRPLREHNPDVDPPLAGLIERCLAFDPAARPENAEELAAELRGHFSLRRRLRRGARARPGLTACLAGLLLLVLLSAGWVAWDQLSGNYAERGRIKSEQEVKLARQRAEQEAKLARQRAEQQLEEGKKALQGGRLDEAEAFFRQAVAAMPDHWEGHHGLGGVAITRGRKAAAEGRPQEAKHHYQNAYEHFHRALQRAQGRGALQAHFGCGRAKMLLNQFPLAIPHFAAVLKPQPDHGPTLACLAYCYGSINNLVPSAGEGKKAVQAGYRNAAVYNNLAWVSSRVGWDIEARDFLTKALRRDPTFPPARLLALEFAWRDRLAPNKRWPLPAGGTDEIDQLIERRRRQKPPVPVGLYALRAKLHLDALTGGVGGRGPAKDAKARALKYLALACDDGSQARVQELLDEPLSLQDLVFQLPWKKEAAQLDCDLVDPLSGALD
jgi:tetratricopeptide (TPR) repeat protein